MNLNTWHPYPLIEILFQQAICTQLWPVIAIVNIYFLNKLEQSFFMSTLTTS
jgi:hypothetical protein